MISSFKFFFIILSGCAFSIAGNQVSIAGDSLISQGINLFYKGYNDWSVPVFQRSSQLFLQASIENTNDYRPHYWNGVVEFHISNYYLFGENKSRNKKLGVKAVDAALASLKTALKLKPDHGESLSLFGTLMGIKIYLRLYLAPVLGPKVFKNIKKGLELAENNPRIHYLIGVNYLFTPEFLGGGVDKGLEFLKKAEILYMKEAERPAVGLEPRWGYSTCLGFIGKALIKKDEPLTAKEYFEKAVKINPKDQLSLTGLKEAEQLIAKGE